MDIYERIRSGEFDAIDAKVKWENKEISYEEYKAAEKEEPYEGFVGYKEFLAGAYGQVTSIVEVSSELTADAGNHHANRVLRMLSPDDDDDKLT